MRKFLLGLVILAGLGHPALACGCDEECKEGEYYSDEAEMCVVKPAV
jgi:hypothetical protein